MHQVNVHGSIHLQLSQLNVIWHGIYRHLGLYADARSNTSTLLNKQIQRKITLGNEVGKNK